MEEIVEVARWNPQELFQQRTVEEIVDDPIPQIQEQIVEVVKVTPQERVGTSSGAHR